MQLDDALLALGQALKLSDFDKISALSAMLETVSIPTDRPALERSARLARENALLLQASAKGLRAAQRRITELGQARNLTTYDLAGKKQNHALGPAKSHRL